LARSRAHRKGHRRRRVLHWQAQSHNDA
jgi:hypothetical protein